MKGTKARTVNTLGMFDLFKGIGMATVIFVHTAESYSIDLGGGLSVTSFLLFIYREALMSAFYIASGYGFRKRSVGKCVQQQLRGILPPFLYTALATAGLHLFLHHHFFGSWEVAVAESEKVLAGFLLGLPHTSDYFGMNIFSCGPMWYLLTMAVGWIILDILFNAFPERYIPCAVAVTAILGWGTCLVWELPFCLSQGMTVVPYLYLGHIMKKRRWLEQPRLPWLFPAAAVCMAVSAVGSILSGATDNMSMGEWTLGPVGIFVNGVIGLWIITLFVRLGSRALVSVCGPVCGKPHCGAAGPVSAAVHAHRGRVPAAGTAQTGRLAPHPESPAGAPAGAGAAVRRPPLKTHPSSSAAGSAPPQKFLFLCGFQNLPKDPVLNF